MFIKFDIIFNHIDLFYLKRYNLLLGLIIFNISFFLFIYFKIIIFFLMYMILYIYFNIFCLNKIKIYII